LNVSVFAGDKCKSVYEERQGFINPSTQLCSGGEKGRDSCVGDSGSALMMEDRSEDGTNFWKQIGIVSFGPRLCGTEGVPGVYTKVRSYVDWILDNVEV
jgi:secreted trypsin-like serine protease